MKLLTTLITCCVAVVLLVPWLALLAETLSLLLWARTTGWFEDWTVPRVLAAVVWPFVLLAPARSVVATLYKVEELS